MTNSNTVITRAVRNYMKQSGTTQADLARAIHRTPQSLSHRLTQRRRWNLDDLARLVELGIIDPQILWEEA